MNWLLNLLVLAGMAVTMEYVAWFTHKYVMHGFLWVLHADHHRPRDRGLQKNDLFAVFFSAVSCALIVTGLTGGRTPLVSAGLGMMLYGIVYVLFHDIMFHRRMPGVRIKARGHYMQRIVHAHKIHHQKGGQRDSNSFGFLYAGSRYDE